MRFGICIFVCAAWLATGGAAKTLASPQKATASPDTGQARTIDGVAARIQDSIITDSEVWELAAFQKLVDGKSKPRAEVIRELVDQWIVRGEADATNYSQPSAQDVNHAYAQLVAQFPSAEEFKKRCDAAGLSESTVRRILREQLYLSRFLDYRFRPAVQVSQSDVEAYYKKELAPQLKAHGQKVPPLDDVQASIREVLVQRAIDKRSKQWIADTRSGLQIDVLPEGNGQ